MSYLDYAGAGIPSSRLLVEVSEQLQSLHLGNPHSRHSNASATRQIVEQTRHKILEYFNADDYEVIFTPNATHSLQIIGNCFRFQHSEENPTKILQNLPYTGSTFAYLNDSHNSVVGMRELVKTRVDNVCCLDFDREQWTDIPETASGLFALTAMSNFSGRIYPFELVSLLQSKGWRVCLDASAFVSTKHLDLSSVKPDFVCFSFYKMFGYPTGVGALLVKKTSADCIEKNTFSGGTVAMVDPYSFTVHQRKRLCERFEDGTTNYFGIAAVLSAFHESERAGGITTIDEKTSEMTRKGLKMLRSKHHWNGRRLVEIYEEKAPKRGPVISFNLKTDEDAYIGYSEVTKMCELFGVQLRTGCFCNIGACMKYLCISPEDLYINYLSGKECGDEIDVIKGRPAGAIRISFGRFSEEKDIDILEQVLDCCFLGIPPRIDEYAAVLSIDCFKPILSHIYYYPIKSAAGIEGKREKLSPTGLAKDRQFMVVSCGVTLTQKKNPIMCTLTPEVNGSNLMIRAKGFEGFFTVSIPSTSSHKNSALCAHSVSTVDCGDDSSQWLSNALHLPLCRLLRVSNDASRSLSNDSPFLLINEASAQVLADVVNLPRGEIISRFRPNLVVKGLPAFLEDTAKFLNIGSSRFEITGKCTRCEMICVDPTTGQKDPALIIALRNYRHREKMTFGIYLRQINYVEGQYIEEGASVSFYSQ